MKKRVWLTPEMPQANDIILACDIKVEGCRLQAYRSAKLGEKGLIELVIIWQLVTLPMARSKPGGNNPLGATVAHTIYIGGIGENGIMAILLLLHLLQLVIPLGRCRRHRAMTSEGHGNDEHDEE